MPTLINLPVELIAHVLSNLTMSDILRCMQTCTALRHVVQESLSLKYQIMLEQAGKVDNPRCSASTSRRLELLVASESSWLAARPPVPFVDSLTKAISRPPEYNFNVFSFSPDVCIYGTPHEFVGKPMISQLRSTPLPGSRYYETRSDSTFDLPVETDLIDVATADDLSIAVLRYGSPLVFMFGLFI